MSRRDAPAAVAPPPDESNPDDPTLEEFLRPLRDRYRFLEDYFNLQAEAVFASCPTDMSADGLFGLNEICREGGDLLDDLLDQLPRDVINRHVSNVDALGPASRRRARRSRAEDAVDERDDDEDD